MNENKVKLLIVDDLNDYREMFSLLLEEKGYCVYSAENIKKAKEIITTTDISMVITDLIMENETGIELLEWVKNYNDNIGVIIVTAYGTVETAVEAIQLGAYNYFIKSSNPESLLRDIERFIQLKQLTAENKTLKNQNKYEVLLESHNDKYQEILTICKKVAKSNISVLLLGESGTGKEVIARYIHEHSDRSSSAFIPVNCQEYSEGILESELFGHEKGSFTGAIRQKEGKFEEANHGTLFLDEIADIVHNTQVKLLRVLENKQIQRVGGNKLINTDIRLISATNKNIHEYIQQNKFREDLFYRINGIVIHIPPLRERAEDIEMFIDFFIKKYSMELKKRIPEIDKKTMEFLKSYNYPGNIRELKNIIERLIVLCDSKIEYKDICSYLQNAHTHQEISSNGTLKQARSKFEAEFIKHKIEESDGDLHLAAKNLDITKRQLNNKILEYNLRSYINSFKK